MPTIKKKIVLSIIRELTFVTSISILLETGTENFSLFIIAMLKFLNFHVLCVGMKLCYLTLGKNVS